jgi:predicted acylesterase/phospholipase RssA/CRP-like cAMP-binding protein
VTPYPSLEVSERIERILAAPLLRELDRVTAELLAGEMELLELVDGEVLLERRAASDALFLLLDGELRATEPTAAGEEFTVRVISAGEVLDEMLLVAGSERLLTVRAAGPAMVARFAGATVDRLVATRPDLRAADERLHRRQLLCRLHPVFGTFDRRLLDDLEATAEWVHLGRGRLLFEQDTPGRGIFFVISGRVKVLTYRRDGSVRVLGEAGRGESTGEAAFFGGGRHPERVQAVRDSVLAGFTEKEFDELTARRPEVLRRVARNLVARQHRGLGGAGTVGRVTNIAIVPVGRPGLARDFTTRLVAALSVFGPVLRLDAEITDAQFSEEGVAESWGGMPSEARLLAWLEAQEAAHRFVVYEADTRPTAWTRRCMRQADRALLVALASDDPRETDLERALQAVETRLSDAHETLVLLHDDGDCLPTGTRRWLDARPYVEEHAHVRLDRDTDFERLARGLAGVAIGVVLGGGGARALAHVGILRALQEAGIPIDMVGGTSMGASIAAQHAMGWDPRRIREVNHEVWVEIAPHRRLTLPIFSVIGNRESERCGRMMYGETEIEDLWIPYFCVSSNLATAERVVHRRGSLLWAATASASIPGAAMPVINDQGELLVDGALLDNVPTDVMRDLGCGTVFAAEVSVEEDSAFTVDRIPSPWEAIRGRLSRRIARVRFPSLLEVAMRASMLHSTFRQRAALQLADFAFRPPIDGFGLMDFRSLDALVETGYTDAREALIGWESDGRIPKLRESLGLARRGAGTSPAAGPPAAAAD